VSVGRLSPGRRGRPWDEESIRDELAAFLHGRTVWPTCDEFAIGGLKGLRDVLPRFGGPERWARGMGLQGGERPPGGVRRWTDQAISSTLSAFLEGRSEWPTYSEFRHAGLGGLYEKLVHEGLLQRWMKEMGFAAPKGGRPSNRRGRRTTPKRQPSGTRERLLWTDQRIADELALFLKLRVDWPRYTEFIAEDRRRLYQAVLNHGGTQLWAQRMGVQRVKRKAGSPPFWTEQRVRERLTERLHGRTVWPGAAEFAAAGERSLLAAVRRLGGIERRATEVGLQPPPHTRRSSSGQRKPRTWNDVEILAAIRPLVEELGRWPTKSEFHRAGLSSALAAVYYHGGSVLWQRRVGLSPRSYAGPVPDRTLWTAQRIEAELRDFCRAHSGWPTLNEFDAAGLGSLYRAASHRGGIATWRQRLGFR
jgi:hypothetical protein